MVVRTDVSVLGEKPMSPTTKKIILIIALILLAAPLFGAYGANAVIA